MSNEATKVEGTIEAVLDTETFPSGFQKRILVVNTGGDYPQLIPIEWLKDKVTMLDHLVVGQTIVVYANMRGNEHNGRYYLSLVGWKFQLDAATQMDMPQAQPAQQPHPPVQQAHPTVEATELAKDDIPF